MSVTRFRTNTMANFSERMIKKSTKKSKEATKRLSSGERINSASDDAAGLAISQKLATQTRGYRQASQNISDARSLVQTAEGGLAEIQQNLQRMRELAVRSVNSTLTPEDRSSLDKEFQQLKAEINRVAEQTEFNKINILGPSATQTAKSDIVFVIDDTGSMGPIQQKLKDNIDEFVDEITKSGVNDIRFGLTEFNDDSTQKNFPSGKWTSDKNALSNAIDSLDQTGGTEDSMQAIQDVMNNYTFRPNNQAQTKHAILVTNEDEDDQGKVTNTISQAQNEGLRVHGVYNQPVDVNGESTDDFDQLTNETGGKNVDLDDSNWGKKLTSEIGGNIGNSSSDFDNNLNFQIGPNEKQNIDLELFNSRTGALGINDLEITSPSEAQKTLNELDRAIEETSSARAEFGSFLNRFKLMTDYNSNTNQNLMSSRSLIQDADFAKEVRKKTTSDILQQTGTSLLSQASNMSEVTLQLI